MKSSSGNTIVKNASFLMGSQLTTWVLTLLLTIFLPRYLGAEGVGQLHLAQSLWIIAGLFITFGMNLLLVKEIARQPEKTSVLFSNSLFIRTIVYVFVFAGMILYARFAGYSDEAVTVIYIIGGSQFFVQFMQTSRFALQGLEKMGHTSIGDIITKVFNVVASIIALLLGYGVNVIAFINVASVLINFLLFMRSLRSVHTIHFKLDFSLMGWMLRASLPYFFSGFFAVAYRQMDVVILSLFIQNEQQVGWYGTADKLFGTMMFIPVVFITAIFPALSRMYEDESDQLAPLISRSFDMLMIISIPIGLGMFVIADPIVVLLFGEEFVNSGPILAIFGLVTILTYQTLLLGRYLISIDKQTVWTWIMIIAAVGAIPLDMILIPWCNNTFGNGAIGGALAYIVTEGFMLIAGLYILPRGYIGRSNAIVALKAIAAGVIMGAAVWMLRDQFILIPLIIGAITYPSLILAFRTINPEDMKLLQGMISGTLNRVRSRFAG